MNYEDFEEKYGKVARKRLLEVAHVIKYGREGRFLNYYKKSGFSYDRKVIINKDLLFTVKVGKRNMISLEYIIFDREDILKQWQESKDRVRDTLISNFEEIRNYYSYKESGYIIFLKDNFYYTDAKIYPKNSPYITILNLCLEDRILKKNYKKQIESITPEYLLERVTYSIFQEEKE